MPEGDAGQGTGGNGDAGQKGGGDDGKITLTKSELDAKMAEVRRGVEKSISEKYADYDDLKAKADKLAELEESKKTSEQKLMDRIASLEKADAEQKQALEQARTEALRARVAGDWGLTDAQAARLQGSTIDELREDAKEVFGEPKPGEGEGGPEGGGEEKKPAVPRQPRTDLKGGSDPTEGEEADVQKIFDSIEL
ncbi:MAG: hypothetical protein ACLFWM_08715 [Actinomycetota bacterium]